LVFSAEVGDRSEASRLEWRIKKLSKAKKERLLSEGLGMVWEANPET
jgi:predicted GIY-YIG superfamily endonuclease